MNAPSLSILQQAANPLPLVPAMPEEPVLPLSVEAYHALLKAGVLKSGDPIELLEGFLVSKMTKGPRHAAAKRRFLRLISPLIPPSCFLDTQEALTTADSEPEPDVYVLSGPESKFNERHPGPGEVEMVVEISESSLLRDRNLKKRIYARAAVPNYWIINLAGDCIEVFTQPSGEAKTQPSGEAKTQPSGEAKTQPSGEAKTQPSGEAKTRPSGEAKTRPSGEAKKPAYAKTAIYRAGDEVPVVFKGKRVGRIAVSSILP